MKNKIRKHMMIIGIFSMCISILLMVFVSYILLRKQVMEDLKTDAYLLKDTNTIDKTSLSNIQNGISDIRVTLIAKDGVVLFDTAADPVNMQNHNTREEIVEARETGEGEAIRKSHTLQKDTYYFAILLDNDMVLRVACESHSIWSILYSAIGSVVMVMFSIFFVCFFLSKYLTKSIIRPIEVMGQNIENMKEKNTYEELYPFIHTISEQHNDIIKNANMRQQFTANVTHELKTPLTAISGYSELIENGMATNADIIHFAEGIHQNANRLLTLINDIIKLSELDVTKEIEKEKIDLYKLVKNSLEMLQMNAEKRGVKLSLSGKSGFIMGDKQMMEELVFNLCDNAIRYNNRGGRVWIHVAEENGCTILEVKDTGIGISKENQKHIFERFYRVDKSRSKQTGGTGLGLAIVKHIVAQHHAEIILESDVGRGTSIKIVFPKVETVQYS